MLGAWVEVKAYCCSFLLEMLNDESSFSCSLMCEINPISNSFIVKLLCACLICFLFKEK